MSASAFRDGCHTGLCIFSQLAFSVWTALLARHHNQCALCAHALTKRDSPLENRRFSSLRGKASRDRSPHHRIWVPFLCLAAARCAILYAIGDALLLVATDRISAFDHVLGTGIPGKGKILTQISLFWFDLLADLVPNHLITADVSEVPCRACSPIAISWKAAPCW